MKRIAAFVDISNLYYCINTRCGGRRLDYQKLLNHLRDMGDVTHAIAYGAQMGTEADGFKKRLETIGWTLNFKTPKQYINDGVLRNKADWDVGIAVDMITACERVDAIVLVSADGDLAPAVKYLRSRMVDVHIIGCGISKDLRDAASSYLEINDALLCEAKQDVQETNLTDTEVETTG